MNAPPAFVISRNGWSESFINEALQHGTVTDGPVGRIRPTDGNCKVIVSLIHLLARLAFAAKAGRNNTIRYRAYLRQ